MLWDPLFQQEQRSLSKSIERWLELKIREIVTIQPTRGYHTPETEADVHLPEGKG